MVRPFTSCWGANCRRTSRFTLSILPAFRSDPAHRPPLAKRTKKYIHQAGRQALWAPHAPRDARRRILLTIGPRAYGSAVFALLYLVCGLAAGFLQISERTRRSRAAGRGRLRTHDPPRWLS